MHVMRLASLAVISLGFAALAVGQIRTRLQDNVAAGQELFHQHCSVCHGNDAKGKGSLYDPSSSDKSVRLPPADLTVLSERNAGKFPADHVRAAVYSKEPIPAHGTPDMPAWGDVFYNQKSNPKLIDARVRNLTAYIESLQVTGK